MVNRTPGKIYFNEISNFNFSFVRINRRGKRKYPVVLGMPDTHSQETLNITKRGGKLQNKKTYPLFIKTLGLNIRFFSQ